jgi:pimeloyl-ACP methyl ester carboxylesterase
MNRLMASDGVSLAWEQWGDENAGPPVVLCHGFGINIEVNWVLPGVVNALVAAGRRVVGLHARGHGDSDKPHDSRFYGEDRMALDVSELIDSLGVGEVDLVGYSMGSVVALIVASRDRRVRRLVAGGVGESVVELGGIDTRVLPGEAVVAALLSEDPAAIAHPGAKGIRDFTDMAGGDRRALTRKFARSSTSPLSIMSENITSTKGAALCRVQETSACPKRYPIWSERKAGRWDEDRAKGAAGQAKMP